MMHLETTTGTGSMNETETGNFSKSDQNNKEVVVDNNSNFPVFKISPKGKIIYSNRASFPVLKAWNCYASNIIPKQVMEKFPALTDLNADETIELVYDIQTFHFSVVGFRTGGYIGVYGFKTVLATGQQQNN